MGAAGRPAVDLVGHRYGRLTVLEPGGSVIGSDGKALYRWRCRCDCGRYKTLPGKRLRQGGVRSCDCLGVESRAAVGATRARPVVGPDGTRYESRAAAALAHGVTVGAVRWHLRHGTGRWRGA